MGGLLGSRQSQGRVIKDPKQHVLARYLHENSTIDEVWDVFRMEGEGGLNNDRNWVSLEDIIYEALDYFCKYRGGLYKKIDLEESKPYIEIIIKNVRAKVGQDLNESLNRDELQKLGLYLKDEFEQTKNSKKSSEAVEKPNKTRGMYNYELDKVETGGGSSRMERARTFKTTRLRELTPSASLISMPETTITLGTLEAGATETLESPKAPHKAGTRVIFTEKSGTRVIFSPVTESSLVVPQGVEI